MSECGWFKHAIVYQILIDRFAGCRAAGWNRPVFLGGSLRGVRSKLDYLQQLGVNTLWLSPFMATSAYHGYHVTDFMAVEPRFGTLQDLEALVAAVHRRGMRIIADFVPNHCSRRHPYFAEARQNRRSRYRKWFVFDRWPDDYRCFLLVRELPKLNLDHPPARRHIIDAALYWLSLGLDGFRLDHVLGPGHSFWQALRRAVKAPYPRAVLLGEAWLEGIAFEHLHTLNIRRKYGRWMRGLSQQSIQQEYQGELDGVLDFKLQRLVHNHMARTAHPSPPPELRAAVQKHYAAYAENYYLPTFLDNHDMSRFLHTCRGEVERLKAAAAFQFQLPAPPIIYYGTESGMTHTAPVAVNRPHSDLQARQPMNWRSPDRKLLAFYQELIRARRRRMGGSVK